MSEQPLSIVAGRGIVYIAPVGESYPLIDATPAGNWVAIGTNQDRSYSEVGVTFNLNQTTNPIYTLGDTLPMKEFRTQEDVQITVMVYDTTLENVKYALNTGTVTDNAESGGVAGYREIDIRRGPNVSQRALLVRMPEGSPYLANVAFDIRLPVVVHIGSPSLVWTKGEPVGVEMNFRVLVDPSAASASKRGGIILAEDAAAT
jgi:hypothetical protein